MKVLIIAGVVVAYGLIMWAICAGGNEEHTVIESKDED